MSELLIYGSYGYTGRLITQSAVKEGRSPVIAGRNADKLEEQAGELGLDYRVFSVDDEEEVRNALSDCTAVLNCAGPFA
ncbi:MAG: NAD(P)H-binding protein, partial [Halobacteria archaeon]|nr:NAD(P)H-binding protein [Halobacteria archaeon]